MSIFLTCPWNVLKRTPLLWLSFILVIFGSRMIVCNHYAVDAPFWDDWELASDLSVHKDTPLLGHVLFKTHVQHIIAFTRLEEFATVKLNGLWQLRIGSVFHSLAYTLFATATTLLIARAVGKHRMLIYLISVLVFAIPWAGDRMLWSLLSSFSWLMLWNVLEAAVLSLVEKKVLRLVLSLVVCTLASISIGSGSLTAVIAACWLFWEIIRGRPETRIFNGVALLLHASLFLYFYSLVPNAGSGMYSDLLTTIKAFLRCLAFPLINLWPVGLIAFAPWLILAIRIALRKTLPTKSETLLLLLGIVVVLQSAGIAIFRGENNNGGVPASRYYDILLIGPLVNFAILLRWIDQAPQKLWAAVLAPAMWSFVTVGGFMLIFFWRVMPWLSLDSGEWEQGLKQAVIASWTRGEILVLPDYVDKSAPELTYHNEPAAIISKYVSLDNRPGSFLPGAMFGGYPLLNVMPTAGFSLQGYPANRKPKPWLRYWGSHSTNGEPDTRRTFESAPVFLTSPYVQFELLLDKKSRFRFYNLGDSSLKLVNVDSGATVDVLHRFRNSFPFIFNDLEKVCIKLPAPGTYKIIATDNELDSGWFAFSEPTASGPLAAFTEPLLNSGKLMVSAGIMLFLTAVLLRRIEAFMQNAGTNVPTASNTLR